MPTHRSAVTACAFAVLLALGACANSAHRHRTVAANEAPPADLVVLVGRATGGGRVQGHSIRADGSVLRWEGRYPEETVQARGRLAPDSVRALWARIRAADGMETGGQDILTPGYSLSVTANGTARRVTWHVPLGTSLPDTPLQRLHDALDAMASRAIARGA